MPDKITYWILSAEEDVSVAETLLKNDKLLYCGFFCHLVVEKALKAVIDSFADERPPKIHDLNKLANIAGLFEELSEQQLALLEELNPLQIEGRYPEYKSRIAAKLTLEKVTKIFRETEGFLCWIKQKLAK